MTVLSCCARSLHADRPAFEAWLLSLPYRERLIVLNEEGVSESGACVHVAGWRARCGTDAQGRLVNRAGRPLSPATIRSRDERENPNSPAARRAAAYARPEAVAARAAARAARAAGAIAAVEAETPAAGTEGSRDLGKHEMEVKSNSVASKALKEMGFKNSKAVAGAMMHGVAFDKGEITVRGTQSSRYSDEPPSIELGARLSRGDPSDAENYGTMKVDVRLGNERAYVGLTQTNGSYRGSIDTMKVLGNLATLGEKMGVKTVDAQANLDMGGYAWARMGFEATDPGYLARTTSDRLERLKESRNQPAGSVPSYRAPKEAQEAAAKWSDEDFDRIKSFVTENATNKNLPAMLSEMKIGGKNVGRHLLRGSSWGARLDLQNPEAVARFKRFTK